MKKLCWIVMIVALTVGLIFTGCAKPAPTTAPAAPTTAPAKPIELTFAHFNPPTAWAQVAWSNPWCEKVEKVTNGRVKVTIYPAGSLLTEREIYDGIVKGIADMGWSPLPFVKGRFPLSEVISLPFLALPKGKVNGETYSSGKVNALIIWTLYEKFPEMQAEWNGVKLLYVWGDSTSFPSTVKNKPVRNQENLKGLKLRALAGSEADVLKALGASPITMPIADVYESAGKGIVDGMATKWAQLASQKFWEVFRYCTPSASLVCSGNSVPMNLNKWNSLPADIQKAIWSISGLDGALFAGDTAWGFGEKDAVLDGMKKAGQEMEIVNLDPGEYEKWKAIAGKPLLDKWVADMAAKGLPGQKVFDEAVRLVEKYRD